MNKGAVFSEDRMYRFALWRHWDACLLPMTFILLNPSTADETKDDPTIRRCVQYARDWDYGGVCIVNIFAFRATDPRTLTRVSDPIGPDNDYHIKRLSSEGMVVAAWGTHGAYLDRGEQVKMMLAERGIRPCVLKLTKDGHPSHPLYLSASLRPVPWTR